ncbi:MAG: hypothetical protein AAGA48_39220 [Myxococcota bacterium]
MQKQLFTSWSALFATVAIWLVASSAYAGDFVTTGIDGNCTTNVCEFDDMGDAVIQMLGRGHDTLCVTNDDTLLETGAANTIQIAVGIDVKVVGADAECNELPDTAFTSSFPDIDMAGQRIALLSGNARVEIVQMKYRNADGLAQGAMTVMGGATTLDLHDVWILDPVGEGIKSTSGTVTLTGQTRIERGSGGSAAIELLSGATASLSGAVRIDENEYSGILVDNSTLNINGAVVIEENVDFRQAGGIAIQGESTVAIHGGDSPVRIQDNLNWGQSGGGMTIDGASTVTVANTRFENNGTRTDFGGTTGSPQGGAIFVMDTATGSLTLDDVELEFNDATLGCRGMLDNSPTITTRIYSSTVRDAICMNGVSDTEFVNTLFSHPGYLVLDEQSDVEIYNGIHRSLTLAVPMISVTDSDLYVGVRTTPVDESPSCVPGPGFTDICSTFDGNDEAIRAIGSNVVIEQTIFRDGPDSGRTQVTYDLSSTGSISNAVFDENAGDAILVTGGSTTDITQTTIFESRRPIGFVNASGTMTNSIMQENGVSGLVTNGTLDLTCSRRDPIVVTPTGTLNEIDVSTDLVDFVNAPTPTALPNDLTPSLSDTVALDACTVGVRPDIIGNPRNGPFDMGAYEQLASPGE